MPVLQSIVEVLWVLAIAIFCVVAGMVGMLVYIRMKSELINGAPK
jgi:hypothetical protein